MVNGLLQSIKPVYVWVECGHFLGVDYCITCSNCHRQESVLNWSWPHYVITPGHIYFIANPQDTTPFPYYCQSSSTSTTVTS